MYCSNFNFFKTIFMFQEYSFALSFNMIMCTHQQIKIYGKVHYQRI